MSELFEMFQMTTFDIEELVKTEMESVYQLSVPLGVDTGSGPNWRDAK